MCVTDVLKYRCHILTMVSLAPKFFVEHGSCNKCNVPAKQNFSNIMSEMAQNFSDIVLKNSDNVRKNKHRLVPKQDGV